MVRDTYRAFRKPRDSRSFAADCEPRQLTRPGSYESPQRRTKKTPHAHAQYRANDGKPAIYRNHVWSSHNVAATNAIGRLDGRAPCPERFYKGLPSDSPNQCPHSQRNKGGRLNSTKARIRGCHQPLPNGYAAE